MKTYFVYILRCSDGSYYTGITSNPEQRIAQHQSGVDSKCYTFKRRPVVMEFIQEFQRVEEAIALEKQVKNWSRAKKAALIRNDFESLKKFAQRKYPNR